MLAEEFHYAHFRAKYKKQITIADLKREIKFGDEIENELKIDRETLILLSKTLARLKSYFSADTTYTLRKSFDLLDDCLILEIWTHWDVEKTMTTLNRFDDEWWLDHMSRFLGGGLVIEAHGV